MTTQRKQSHHAQLHGEPAGFRRSALAAAMAISLAAPAVTAAIPDSGQAMHDAYAAALPVATLASAHARDIQRGGGELQITSGARQVVFIDESVADRQQLINAVAPGAELHLLRAGEDGVKQVAATLAGRSGVQAVHLIAHGSEGKVALGDALLDAETLHKHYAPEMALIRASLAEGADMLVYSCESGRGAEGRALVDELALVTGADVAASDDLTGSAGQGGDWELEIASGVIDAEAPFSKAAMRTFPGLLALPANGTVNFSGWAGSGTALVSNAYFDLTANNSVGSATMSVGGTFAYINDLTNSNFTNAFFNLAADGVDVESFELTQVVMSEYLIGRNMGNIYIKGYLSGGGTVTSSTLNGTDNVLDTFTFGAAQLGAFSGQQITHFRVFFSDVDIDFVYPQDINFESFSIANATAPVTQDSDGTLVAAGGVAEPVDLPSTAAVGSPVSVFDFTIGDGGTADGLTLDVSQIDLNLGGTASANFSKLRFNLTGCATQSAVAPVASVVSFSGAPLVSVADGGSSTCTVQAYWADNTGLTDNQTLNITIDGDVDLTVDAAKTQMSGANAAVATGNMATSVTATALSFTTQPAGSVSGAALTTQPVVKAVDAASNVDVDFAELVTLTEASLGTLINNTATAISGVATFAGLTYTASVDQESFTLTANDVDGTGSNLPTVNANAVASDVVATQLQFAIQPAPTSVVSGQATAFSTVPVVRAVDGNGVTDTGYATDITLAANGAGSASMTGTGDTDGSAATVSITPSVGVSTFTGLNATYTASGTANETFTLRATSGGLTLADSSNITATTAPLVSSVSVPANATYVAGQNLDFTVNTSELVTVNTAGGTPTLALTIGATAKSATYVSGSGTSALLFRYTVEPGLSDTDGIALGASIALNGGTLQDVDANDMNTTLNSVGSLAAVLVDSTAPVVNSVSVPANTTYATGANLDFTVNTSEAVAVNTGGGTPTLALTIGATAKSAAYISGSGSTALLFRYTVEPGLTDADGVALGGSIALNGGTLQDGAGNNLSTTLNAVGALTAVLVDSVAPVVNSVTVPANATYATGSNLDFTVNTSENVTVNTGGGTPTLALTIGATAKSATYVSGSGTSALLFRYTVEPGLTDADGIALGGSIALNGGTLQDAAGNNLNSTLSAVGALTAVLVDSVAPIVNSVTVPANATYAANDNLDFIVNTSENVTVSGTPSLALTIGATAKNASYVSGSGTSALLFRYTVEPGLLDADGITLGASIALNAGTLQDAAGNNLNTTLNAVGALTAVLVDSTNLPPTIGGAPATGVGDDVPYSFTPTANDPDGDGLTFSIVNKPTWATFSTTSGALTGTPVAADIGVTTGIVISVTDSVNAPVSLAAFDLEVFADNDNDNIADSVDPDDDNDGMTDVWENANGLDPLNAADAALDSDGDGLSNLAEFQQGKDPQVDDVAPVLTVPADVAVNATGLFTAVDLGLATANDALDGAVVPSADASGHFAPGAHVVTWSASDVAGNIATATQNVSVTPLVEFGKDQIRAEGSTVLVPVVLNGDPIAYPVTIPYTVGGTAAVDGSDHDLTAGTATITAVDGREVLISFTLVDDGPGEGTETVLLTMGNPGGAVAGPHATHTVQVIESNVAPMVSLSAVQQAEARRIIPVGDGPVVVSSLVDDPNPGDTHTYDWTATDIALSDTDGAAATFTFDPSALAAGLYNLRLTVTDNTGASQVAQLVLNVVATAPVLSNLSDSDGDTTDDLTEGFGDGDGDGVPEYLDAIAAPPVLQEQAGVSGRNLMESEPGLSLRLGAIALGAGNGASAVSEQDILNGGGQADSGNSYNGGLFDFVVGGLPQSGQTVRVVIPQLATIPANAVYRKLMPSGWQNFVEDANNNVASAAGANGFCPAPGDAAYTPGLTEGHWCVQLSIEDGGPNDADGAANNSISDPGGVTVAGAGGLQVTGGGGELQVTGGGGAVHPLWLLALLGLAGVGLRRRGLNEEGR